MNYLAIVIVSWNTRDLLRRCIASIHASLENAGIDYAIIVVDNASSDGTPAMLCDEHPEVQLLEPGRNLGFAGGNNLALRKTLSSEFLVSSLNGQHSTFKTQHSTFDYVFLLNPDTEVVGDAIPQLVFYLDAHPDVAVVGPQLRYADGSAQPSRRRFPTRATFFLESTPLTNYWPNNPWARRYRCADTPDDTEQRVDWLVGAALLVRREAIECAGLLDAGFRMYSEELEWQQRIQQAKQGKTPQDVQHLSFSFYLFVSSAIVYLPSAVIIHHEGKSSEQAPARRYIDFQRSRVRHARMLYGARFAMILQWFLVTLYAAELLVEAAKWLAGHKRPLRASRMRVYWQVVRALRSTDYTDYTN